MLGMWIKRDIDIDIDVDVDFYYCSLYSRAASVYARGGLQRQNKYKSDDVYNISRQDEQSSCPNNKFPYAPQMQNEKMQLTIPTCLKNIDPSRKVLYKGTGSTRFLYHWQGSRRQPQ